MEAILIQPPTKFTGSFVRMIPLGVLYAASTAIKNGHTIKILDCRISPSTWKTDLTTLVTSATKIIGISVMSGISIVESLSITRFVKGKYPEIKIVWGGPHGIFGSEEVMSEPAIDYLIRGYGSQAFYELLENLESRNNHLQLPQINGLSWRDEDGNAKHNEIVKKFEFINYRDIPYFLISDYSVYFHADENETVFPMYSAMGCPYNCAFCSSPAQYSAFAEKWLPYPVMDIVAHIKHVMVNYGATYIYFIDDDSFVDLEHVEAIIDGINKIGITVKLGFRGARINEILGMSDAFLDKLTAAGTKTMHIGAESGSDRILALMNKNISVQQIIEVNRKLARHPEIMAVYNFVAGSPGETLEETMLTRDLVLQLIKDNKSCVVLPINKARPLPGTPFMEFAVKAGFLLPKTLEEWGKFDFETSDFHLPWLTQQHEKYIRMMFLCMYFIDNKITKFNSAGGGKRRLLTLLAFIYKPIAMYRFKTGDTRFLIEEKIYPLVNI